MRLAWFLLALLALARPAAADDDSDTAAQLFRSASAAFERKEYRAAAIGFEEAHRRRPHAATMANAALAWEAAGEPARAADAFAISLAEPGLSSVQAAEERGKLDALEKQLGNVVVSGPAGATVTLLHVQRGALPRSIHVPPGQHDVAIEYADGAHATRTVRVAAGERQAVHVDAPPPVAPPPPVVSAHPSTPPTRPDVSDGSVMRGAGWVGIGAGAVAFGVGVFLGVRALDARDGWEASKRTDLELYDRADSLRTWTNVVWIGAAVLGATGVVLLVAAPRRAPAKPSARGSMFAVRF